MSGLLQRMAGWFGAFSPRPTYDIGMHIGLERLTLVQLQAGGGSEMLPEIRAAASIAHGASRDELIAQPARLKALLKRAFAEQPFRGKRVVTCLPNDHVRTLLLSYTVAEGASEADSVVQELRERVKEELDGMVVDYIPVRQEHPSRPKEAIVAMAERDKVLTYLEALSAAGIQVASLDVTAAALARLMCWVNAAAIAESSNLLLISLGFRNSFLTVVWGRRLMLDRPVEFSEQRLLSRLKNILDLDEPDGRRLLLERGVAIGARSENGGPDGNEIGQTLKEVLRPEFAALRAEVANTLAHTSSRTYGRSVDGIYVSGAIARYPGIENLLREQFDVPLTVLEPCSIFKHHLSDTQLSSLRPRSGVAAAAGLALRGVKVPWPMSI